MLDDIRLAHMVERLLTAARSCGAAGIPRTSSARRGATGSYSPRAFQAFENPAKGPSLKHKGARFPLCLPPETGPMPLDRNSQTGPMQAEPV